MKRAWLLLFIAASADAQQLGRLFTTPAERTALDRQRGGLPPPTVVEPALPPPAALPAALPASVSVDGFVRRGNGKATVWINQQAQEDARIDGAAVSLPLPAGGRIRVQPGQRLDPVTGKVEEAHADR